MIFLGHGLQHLPITFYEEFNTSKATIEYVSRIVQLHMATITQIGVFVL